MDDNKLQEMLKELIKKITDEPRVKIDPKDAKALEELSKQYTKLIDKIKDQNKNFGMLNQMIAANRAASASLRENFEELDNAILNAADETQKATLTKQREELKQQATIANTRQIMNQFGQTVGKSISMVFAGAGKFVQGLQGNASGVNLASDLMTAGLDVAGQASQMAGNTVGQLGQTAMMSTNPRIKALGAAAAVAGPLLGALGESASKLAKFGVEVLAKEVEKTYKAFNSAAASGALFAGGMTDLRNAANSAGLTVDQFSGVLTKHSTDIAAAGLGVSEGSKRVGAALRTGGDTMRKQLLNLGYGFEEQAGLVAETMRDMRQSGGPLKASNAEVAAQTQKYAENLRVISGITGEDAKKKMDQVRQQANQLAFQQKLAGMDETQRSNIVQAMANMSDVQRKNFMDMVNFGTVINQEGAIQQALSPGLRSSVEGFAEAFRNGNLDAQEARKIQAANAEQSKKDLLDQTAIGMAGAAGVGGLVQSLSESMGKELEFRNTWNKEAIEGSTAATEGQKNATDKLTESVTGAETAAQNLKIALEQELTPAIGRFAEVSKEMLGGVQKMLKDLGLGEGQKTKAAGGEETMGLGEGVAKAGFLTSLAGYGLMGLGGLASMTGIGAAAGVPMMAAGSAMATGGNIAALGGSIAQMFGFAGGGIAEGDEQGFMAKLHGRELIVPLVGDELDQNSEGYKNLQAILARGVSKGTETQQPGGIFDGLTSFISEMSNPLASLASSLTDKMASGSKSERTTSMMGDSADPEELKKLLEELNMTAREQLMNQKEMVSNLERSISAQEMIRDSL